ncbi:MAG: sugar phosphate isomerase/epimerase [Bryobacterales bacterium]|nr:sugar phosphate isomerase/epimerase [Bryobacterales bacterium]
MIALRPTRRHLLTLATLTPLMAAKRMKMSLSVRVAEAFDNKEKSTKTIDELIALAKSNGYEALCMRASQAGTHTPPERIEEIASKIKAAGLAVSMITGDFAVPSNNDKGPECLRRITPYLDLADRFHSKLIRICMKKDDDIQWAQRASDEARERGIRLAHQSHCSSLFETVEGAERVLKAVGRPNFGLIYEPANWLISGQPYGRATVVRLRPYLFNFYIQNHHLTPSGKAFVDTWTKGRVPLDHIGVWEKGGVDAEDVFAGLRAVGYSGYITVHQAFGNVMPVEEAVRKSYRYLQPLTLAKRS